MKAFYQKNRQRFQGLYEQFLQFEGVKQVATRFFVISIPYGWHIVFFLIPFCLILKMSFAESIIGSPPYTEVLTWLDNSFLQIRLNLGNYLFLLEDDLYLNSYLESLKIATTATVGCLVLGYPIAYAITRLRGIARTVCLMAIILPFWTSFLIRVYAWIGILSPKGLLNNFLLWSGVIHKPLSFMDNNSAVTIGLVYTYLPFMIMPLYTALEKINHHYLEAAYDLGCKPLKAFFKIIIPLSYRGIVAGAMLVFIPSVGEFVIPALLGGSSSIMIGKVLWNEFFMNHDWPLAAALVVSLFLILFVPLVLFQRFLSSGIEKQQGGF